ncbi:MAG TPA: DUF362 domain-containing protein [Terriglobales bacterium]|nr:DUF362 domain-containing protein [Terriglobales bacterium]
MRRRDFIKSSLAAGAALGLSSFVPLESFGEKLQKVTAPDLAVATGGAPGPMVRKTIDLLGGMKNFVSPGDIVVVKPNIGWDRKPEQAANTNPEIVSEVIKMCLEAGAKKVKVFDRSCNAAQRCYESSGIKKAASEAGAEVTYTLEPLFKETRLPSGMVLKSWPLYKPALECDVLINIPIAKHHGMARLTLGMKNLMGIMGGDRGNIHQSIDEKLADAANFIKPKLTIQDAYRILTNNGPTGGNPRDVKLTKTVIAGKNIASVDAYGTTLFGLKPTDLPCIALGNKFGLGEIDLNKLAIERYSFTA